MGKSRKAPSRKVPTGKGSRIHVDFSKLRSKAKERRRTQTDDDLDEPLPPENPRGRRRSAGYEAGPANPGGVYLPDHEQLVRLIAARGLSDPEIEMIYGLGTGTLAKWKKHYPGLSRAIDEGRTVADSNVLFALYKTATGYCFEEEQAVGGRDPQVLRVRKHKPGEFAAQKHWLGNRIKRSDNSPEWPRSEQLEVTGAGGGKLGIQVESRNDLITSILSLINPKADRERTRTRKDEEDGGGRK